MPLLRVLHSLEQQRGDVTDLAGGLALEGGAATGTRLLVDGQRHLGIRRRRATLVRRVADVVVVVVAVVFVVGCGRVQLVSVFVVVVICVSPTDDAAA